MSTQTDDLVFFFFLSSCFFATFCEKPCSVSLWPETRLCSYKQHADFKFVLQIAQSIHHMLTADSNQSFLVTRNCHSNESCSLSTSASSKMTSSARCSSVSERGWLCEVHVNSPESRRCNRHVVPICLFSHTHSHTERERRPFIYLTVNTALNTQQTHCFFNYPPQKENVCVGD